MDRVTSATLAEFAAENAYDDLPTDKQFEHLAAFLAVRRHYSRAFSTDDVVTGSGADTGIDGIAIIVNGALVTDADQVQELLEQNGDLEVTFIFVQAETTSAFNSAKIGSIAFGVVDFFSPTPKLKRNDMVAAAAEIMSVIYDHSTKFRRRPACRVYYITTGPKTDDADLNGRREAAIQDIGKSDLFCDVEFLLVGANDIQRLYRQTKSAVGREFLFKDKTEIPMVDGVAVAFLGYVLAKDFLSIISDDSGDDILGSIFYDNVRDWQNYNAVNAAMRETLVSDKRSRFVIMNNGVTIITKTLKQAGSKFYIEDFQIVNGCQTSHVIFDHREILKSDESVAIPLRLINTKDEDVIEAVILATNRQTELSPEQLFALRDFSKKLEGFFESYPSDHRLYYERRDGQYDNLPIPKNTIVAPKVVIRAFAAMFLGEARAVTKNYKTVRDMVGHKIFGEGDMCEPYYVAAYSAYRLEQQFKSGKIPTSYKSARYHILLALRLLMGPATLPLMNSKAMKTRSEVMIKQLWDDERTDELFQKARAIIDVASDGNLSPDNVRTETMTNAIYKQFGIDR